MKKFAKIIALIILCAITTINLCACTDENIIGTWNIKRMSGVSDEEMTQMLQNGYTMRLKFGEDQICVLTYSYENESSADNYEYFILDSRLILNGAEMEYEISGNTLKLTDGDGNWIELVRE